MRTSVFVGISLDGFIARAGGAFDFLTASGAEADNGYAEFFATVDALVIGRHTYDIVRSFPAWPYGSTPVYVLSTRSLTAAPSGSRVERLSGTPAEICARLAAGGCQHVYVDGGITIQRFLRAGLIQHLTITRVPILIGAGVPLFGPIDGDIRLRHVASRTLAGGAVQSEYEIRAEPHPGTEAPVAAPVPAGGVSR